MAEAWADMDDKERPCLGMPFRNSCTGLLQNAIYISHQGGKFIWEARQMAVVKQWPTVVSSRLQASILNLGTGRTWHQVLLGLLLLKSDTLQLMAVLQVVSKLMLIRQ